jgi:hypothetical protein
MPGRSNSTVQSVQPLALDAATIRPYGITRYALSSPSNTIRVRPVAFGGTGTSCLVHVPFAFLVRWNVRPHRVRSAA